MKNVSYSIYTTRLAQIYGSRFSEKITPRLEALVEKYREHIPFPRDASLSERDVMMITYPDQVREPGRPPLKTLNEFCTAHLMGMINGLHVLPFFPWSSDDGFSVKDYRSVDSTLGQWDDVERLGEHFKLMFDGVINHASVQGKWFQAFLQNEAPYCDYFLTVQGNPDLSSVVRPRALPLLTEFQTTSGKRRVWTTFSSDQADLDYHNPDVLLEIFDILLSYIERGAQFLRLDAIAYLWKEIGSSCIHLPQTHAIIHLLRSVLDELAPHVRLITETNVSHDENISYFGNGKNEAQLVYNFALPPLVFHTILSGDATKLSQWASGLQTPSDQTAFFNFLASHDGIGLNPVSGILTHDEINPLVGQTLAHGGLVSNKMNRDGTQSPYELNINYFDALSNPNGGEPLPLQVDRFMAAQAILLSLRGVPGIYFHSLFGSRNWLAGVRSSGRNRSINREKLLRRVLDKELLDPTSLRSAVFHSYRELLVKRILSPAFHPHGGQEILDLGPDVFAVLRSSTDGKIRMLCVQNVTARNILISLPEGQRVFLPYQTLWEDAYTMKLSGITRINGG